ncbi:septum formation inhibitor Maf [Marinobacter lipolyticus]|uniref:Maf family protein n=1 Tax=Marinobacter lipolyticus TaxID=209639 RepID=UPI001BCE3773|nr:Maf family protein [Marinobacter lipolyticus]MBS8240679.1 septum formation inhibitor Maf [Marinobacter lipolyticus]
MHTLVLASASPRRAELLSQIGLTFITRPVGIDETVQASEPASAYVERLAREKALAAAGDAGELVIGSDTSVVLSGEILGKPVDAADASATLMRLSGQTHQVMTAVALVRDGVCTACVVTTDVTFRSLSEQEIQAYVATGEPMDKAGSYGIQGLGGIFVKEIRGSYSSVVGLPLQETAALLAQAGYPVWQTWH